jgi:hypothetical protein
VPHTITGISPYALTFGMAPRQPWQSAATAAEKMDLLKNLKN